MFCSCHKPIVGNERLFMVSSTVTGQRPAGLSYNCIQVCLQVTGRYYSTPLGLLALSFVLFLYSIVLELIVLNCTGTVLYLCSVLKEFIHKKLRYHHCYWLNKTPLHDTDLVPLPCLTFRESSWLCTGCRGHCVVSIACCGCESIAV